ncbi:L-aspartate oxidase [Egicoccus halophilus]|uniref:L-aspartate oxidase n=1 Tax=Egicoccus halophilus TaxID=1670830 RepID=A0A8J3EYN4_9ACTN|nr:FAD-binding protein [Egicoccus halophilus]GGI08234.1 L-aspartate oxidase [Egicoccus halophilus]
MMTTSSIPPSPAIVDDRVRADVVIVGAGVAGLYAAARLPDHLEVVVVDKGVPGGDSGSSPWAQGGLAVALGPDDSPAVHAADTRLAGDGLCDPVAVDVLTREAPGHVRQLLRMGAQFDRVAGELDSDDPGHLDLAREGGQRVPRSVHRADATGAELVRVLRAAAAPKVSRLAGIAVGLAQDDARRVTGLWVLVEGRVVAVEARAVLLATGGCGGLFAATTNPAHATADGVALALAAGAAVRDLEFVQFHPTGLAVAGTWRFLLTEALRGAGATLHDAQGNRFLLERHPDAELAPRHVVAKAILDQHDGTAWLDATHLSEQQFASEFPTVLAGARRYGFDLVNERVPVTPAAHYQVGGVRTDLDGRTSLHGLYAAGEVASTGVHGANRMAGNSLSEALVFGARAVDALVAELPSRQGDLGPAPALASRPSVATDGLRDRLRSAMLTGAGPVRTEAGLATVAAALDTMVGDLDLPAAVPDEVELWHALRVSRLLVRAARLRTESRGGHWRDDHPASDDAWADVHLEHVATRRPGDG